MNEKSPYVILNERSEEGSLLIGFACAQNRMPRLPRLPLGGTPMASPTLWHSHLFCAQPYYYLSRRGGPPPLWGSRAQNGYVRPLRISPFATKRDVNNSRATQKGAPCAPMPVYPPFWFLNACVTRCIQPVYRLSEAYFECPRSTRLPVALYTIHSHTLVMWSPTRSRYRAISTNDTIC